MRQEAGPTSLRLPPPAASWPAWTQWRAALGPPIPPASQSPRTGHSRAETCQSAGRRPLPGQIGTGPKSDGWRPEGVPVASGWGGGRGGGGKGGGGDRHGVSGVRTRPGPAFPGKQKPCCCQHPRKAGGCTTYPARTHRYSLCICSVLLQAVQLQLVRGFVRAEAPQGLGSLPALLQCRLCIQEAHGGHLGSGGEGERAVGQGAAKSS